MSSACVFWFPWPHLCSGVSQINQLDGIEYVAAGAARELALKTPQCPDGQHRKQHRKRRFPGGSENGCVRYRARYKNHVWSYDFVTDWTEDGRQLRLLVVIDEYTQECLAIEVGLSFTTQDVMGVLQYLFAVRGTPEHIRSDSLGNDTGPEFVSTVICRWLKEADIKTLFIAKGSPWENGYVESFNGTLRDDLLNREIFLSFEEACWVIDHWRLDYSHHRIHSSLDYQTPAAYAANCVLPASATPQPPEHNRFPNPNPLTEPGAKIGGSQFSHSQWCNSVG